MSYRQVRTPNLDPVIYVGNTALTGWLGWCLAYVEVAFGTPRLYATAWLAWLDAKKKHLDRNFPVGVYFALWFDGWYNGSREGHVVIGYFDGSQLSIWSSPVTDKPYADRWTSIEAVEANYTARGTPASQKITYVGWSEDIAGVSVIEPVATTNTGGNSLMTPNFISRTYYMVQGRLPSQAEIDFHMQKSNPESFINGFGDTPLWKSLQAQVATLSSQVTDLQGRVQTLTGQITTLNQQITTLKGQLADEQEAHKKDVEELEEKLAEKPIVAPAPVDGTGLAAKIINFIKKLLGR